MDYIYDGSFEGLLTCVHHHYYIEKASGIFTGDTYQMNMLGDFMEVTTDTTKSNTVYEAMENKIGHYAVRCIYKAFLSSYPDKEMRILRFIVMGFKIGPKLTLMHGDVVVKDIEEIMIQIRNEAERMRQFVRFSEVDGGVLYGQIEPDHDVTELIANHFVDRYKNQPIIIHDIGRNKALFAYKRQWYISDFTSEQVPVNTEAESQYQRLWQNYFDNIAIKERTNPKCQRNFVPMRYRKHLVEFNIRDNEI